VVPKVAERGDLGRREAQVTAREIPPQVRQAGGASNTAHALATAVT
jgi:hypothetical protein